MFCVCACVCVCVCVCFLIFLRFAFRFFVFHFVFPRSRALLFVCLSVRFVGLLILCACKHFNEFFMSQAHWLSPAPLTATPPSHMSLRTSQVVVKLIKYSRRKCRRAGRGSSSSFVYTKNATLFTLGLRLFLSIFKWSEQVMCTQC